MVARLLNVCGLYLGSDDDMMPAHAQDNPAGYWENLSFTQLNDDILAALGGSWDNLPDLEPEWWKQPTFDAFRERAAALIEDFEQQSPWGWKDPRNCLTLPFWLDVVPDLTVLFCLRNPLEVVWSLSRGGETRSVLAKTTLRLWQSYHEQLLNTIRPTHFVTTHYASYFYDNKKELQRVLEALDLAVSEAVVQEAITTIKPALRHVFYGSQRLPQKEVPRRIIQLYRMLSEESGPVYQQLLADDAYWLEQQKTNNPKQYILLTAEADRALRALKEGEALKAAQEHLNESVSRLEEERATLETENAHLVASVDHLEGEKAASEAERAALSGKVARLKGEKAALEADRITLTGSVSHFEGEKEALAESVARLEKQRDEQETENTRLVALIGRLEGEKTVLETERVALAGSVGHLEEEKVALVESVALLKGEKMALETERVALKNERAMLEADRVALAGSIGHLEGEKAALTEAIDRLEGQREELEAKNMRLVASVGRLEGEKAALETQRVALRIERAALETERTALEIERAAVETEQATFETKRAALEAERAVLEHQREEVVAVNTQMAASIDRLEEEQAVLVETVARLDKLHQEQEAENARLMAWVGALENEKSLYRAQRDNLQRARDRMRRSLLVRIIIRLQSFRRIGVKRMLKKIIRAGRPASPLRLIVDYPFSDSAPVLGPFYVSGWTSSSASPIERVEVFLGDKSLGVLQHGIARPDVAAAFPTMVNAGHSGYEHMFTLYDVPPGEYELVIRATDTVGNSQSVHRRIMIAVSPTDAPPAAHSLPAAALPADAPPADVLPEGGPQNEEEQVVDQKKRKYIRVDRALWHNGYLEVEGWVIWPNSQPPRIVHVWLDDHLVGTTRCNLSRPDVSGHFPDDLKAYCLGFSFSQPLLPEDHAERGDKKAPFLIEVADREGHKLRQDLALRYDDGTPQQKGVGIERSLREFVVNYQTRFGRQPGILDWNTGLQLKQRFPEIAIFSPPRSDEHLLLPYIDESIDVVFYLSSEPGFATEARRVATGALLTINNQADPSLGPQVLVEWLAESEALRALPSASIIIPAYNQATYTKNCLEQIRRTLPEFFTGEIIVVDDNSTDETPEMLAAMAQDWSVLTVIRNPKNLGFIDSCNRGAQAASRTFLIFLNNDTLPQPGWFVPLFEIFDRYDDAGAVGGKLIYPDGTLQEAGGVIFSDGSGWNFGRNDPAIDHPLFNHVREVDYCSGALLATKREVFLRLGGFDTRYRPAYFEDSDYAFKLRQEGFKVYYQPESLIIHFEGITSGTDIKAGVKQHQAINKRAFVEKWRQALTRQPPPPPDASQKTRYQLVVRDEIEDGDRYAY